MLLKKKKQLYFFLLLTLSTLFCTIHSMVNLPINHHQTTNTFDVLIIGAGISGLAAAKKLNDYNFNVTILEASPHIGGRIITDRTWGNENPNNLGAGWIHGKDNNPITTILQQIHPSSESAVSNNTFNLYTTNGKKFTLEETEEFYTLGDNCIESLCNEEEESDSDEKTENETPDVIDESIESKINKYIEHNSLSSMQALQLKLCLSSKLTDDCAANLCELSFNYYKKPHSQFQEGGDTILPEYDRITNHLAININIQTNKKVTHITYNSHGTTLLTDTGEKFFARYCICTIPLGVLQKNTVIFEPKLPDNKLNAITTLKMGSLNRVILKFDKKFWDGSFTYLKNEQETPFFCDYGNNQPILTAFFGANSGKEIDALTDQEAVAKTMQILHKLFDTEEKTIPDPTDTIVTHWGKNPYSYGSYSYVPVGASEKEFHTLAMPLENSLFFAGEATCTHDSATTHGAYLSGIREANTIIKLKNLTYPKK